jgi:hypothetical protein
MCVSVAEETMSLSSLVLAVALLPAQTPVASTADSGWSVGAALGFGFGFRQGTDRLEEELRRVQATVGETPSARLGDRRVREPTATLRLFVDRSLISYLGAGLDLGLFFWDRRVTSGFRKRLIEDYGVEPVAASEAGVAARLGPRLVGRLPLPEGLAAELAVSGGFWLDLAASVGTAGGWYVRPTAGLTWRATDALSLRLDGGYVYMPHLDKWADELRGVELEVGAAWIL